MGKGSKTHPAIFEEYKGMNPSCVKDETFWLCRYRQVADNINSLSEEMQNRIDTQLFDDESAAVIEEMIDKLDDIHGAISIHVDKMYKNYKPKRNAK